MAQAEGRLKTWAMLIVAVGILVIFLFGSCDGLGLLVMVGGLFAMLGDQGLHEATGLVLLILGCIGASLVPIGLAILAIRWANHQRE